MSSEVILPGDIIILLGEGQAEMDGRATGSSKEHTEESLLTSGAEVQKVTFNRKNILRLFRRPEATDDNKM